ncbi:MaoC family dehydratase N-terminal domain-containing protein [Aerococcaceae bacterium DSM 111021]|nr:MaoC family dehydratase N-terminal domain-containing protein [Aerococcaceae bacterium DSM 111021]
MTKLYLDNLHIGDGYKCGTHVFEEEEIKAFAKQFDPQPFHLDNELAKETFFKGLSASGWHVSGVMMRLIVESVHIAEGIIGTGASVKWKVPVRPADEIYVLSTIKDIAPSKSNPNQAILTIESKAYNQEGILFGIRTYGDW